MARLIDADKIINDLEAMRTQFDAIALDGLIRGIEEQPTIDAVPVRQGRWVEWWPPEFGLILTGEEMLWMCSECTAKFVDNENMRFCPNCGAKMDGGAEDEN